MISQSAREQNNLVDLHKFHKSKSGEKFYKDNRNSSLVIILLCLITASLHHLLTQYCLTKIDDLRVSALQYDQSNSQIKRKVTDIMLLFCYLAPGSNRHISIPGIVSCFPQLVSFFQFSGPLEFGTTITFNNLTWK